MRSKISAIPGVSSVTISTRLPHGRQLQQRHRLRAGSSLYSEGQFPPLRRFAFVIPGFFSTAGTPLVAGRDFTWNEVYEKLPVAIISENFAREYWDSPANALGKRIRVASTDDWREIVGVAANVYGDGVNKTPPSMCYWPPLLQRFEGQAQRVENYTAFGIRSPLRRLTKLS